MTSLLVLAALSGPVLAATASESAEEEAPSVLKGPLTAPLRLDVQVDVPKDWVVEGQNREQVIARSPDDKVTCWVATGSFQVDLDEAAATANARRALNRLRTAGYSDVKTTSAALGPVGDVTGIVTRAEGKAEGKADGVALMASWPVEGGTVHVGARGHLADEQEVSGMMDLWRTVVHGAGPAADLSGLGGSVTGSNGVGATLGEGWRRPLEHELESLRPALKNIGQQKYDSENCWSAIRPSITDDADFVIACHKDLMIGVLDEHSLSMEDAQIRSQLFGGKGASMEGAQVIEGADRYTLVYDMPADGRHDADIAVTPYGSGALVTYALVRKEDGQTARSVLEPLVASATFPGDNNGRPTYTAAQWVSYTMRARLGLVALALSPLLVGFVVLFRRASAKQRAALMEDDVY